MAKNQLTLEEEDGIMVERKHSHHRGKRIMSNGFMRYEMKNGAEYASVYKAKRIGRKKTNEIEYLGRVIDKAQGIYQNRSRGIFSYSIERGYEKAEKRIETQSKEKLILDFGDVYVFDEILKKTGLRAVYESVLPEESDTLLAMVAHRTLDSSTASRYALEWWEGSYARMLYPEAELRSQRISEFLCAIGDESRQRGFFRNYLSYLSAKGKSRSILVDSTGLPNDIQFPLTAINNHNGVVSNETRLILVVDRCTKMPIYFRYAAGNIVDVSTLKTTLLELSVFGIDVDFAIVDAGYYSEGNVREMQESGISFIVRLVSNRKLYKELVDEHADSLDDAANMVCYRQRLIFVKKVPIDLFGVAGYAYVAVDVDRKHDEIKRYAKAALENKDISPHDMNQAMRTKGLFILLSSKDVSVNDILPLYYERQAIEHVFDFSKNNVDLLPLRVHTEDAFRGHLLLSFLASAAYIAVNNLLDGSDDCAMSSFHLLRNLKCKVFDSCSIVLEPDKRMNAIAKHLKLVFPSSLDLW